MKDSFKVTAREELNAKAEIDLYYSKNHFSIQLCSLLANQSCDGLNRHYKAYGALRSL